MTEPRRDGTNPSSTPTTTKAATPSTTTEVRPAASAASATEVKKTTTTATGDAAPAARAAAARPAAAAGSRRVRKARLRLARLDPWSVMKTAFLFSIAGGIMFWVATYVVWGVIGSSGLFDAINKMVSSIMEQPGETNKFKIETYISTNKVLGLAALLAAVDIVIFTALATLGSFLYNLSATMLGGIEVTLAED